MTGPPHVSGKTSPARTGNPDVETSSTTVFQLSLASVLPWLETGGDRTLRKPNTVAALNSVKNGGGSIKPQSITSAVVSGAHDSKFSVSGSVTSPAGSSAISYISTSSRSKFYNIQFPTLYHGRSLRTRGSVSSSSGVGSGGLFPGNGKVSPVVENLACVPLPAQGSPLGVQTLIAGSQDFSLVIRG